MSIDQQAKELADALDCCMYKFGKRWAEVGETTDLIKAAIRQTIEACAKAADAVANAWKEYPEGKGATEAAKCIRALAQTPPVPR